jgi:hypothetical protein
VRDQIIDLQATLFGGRSWSNFVNQYALAHLTFVHELSPEVAVGLCSAGRLQSLLHLAEQVLSENGLSRKPGQGDEGRKMCQSHDRCSACWASLLGEVCWASALLDKRNGLLVVDGLIIAKVQRRL